MPRPTRSSLTSAALTAPIAVAAALAAVLTGAMWPVSAEAEPRRALVVTDSILLGAQGPLVGRLQGAGWTVDFDGSVSRSTSAGVDAVRSHGPALYDALVVGLGANDSGNTATFRSRVDAVMAAAGVVPHVYWLTIREVRPYYAPANQVLRDAAARYPNLSVIDWNAAAAGASGLTATDGLHLTSAGAQHLAELVAATVAFGAAPVAPAPAPEPVGEAMAVPGPVSATESTAPTPGQVPSPSAEPASAPVAVPSPHDLSALVAIQPALLDDVQPVGSAADPGGGVGIVWWVLVAGALVAGAYLLTSRLATRSALAASLSRTSGPVRRAPLSRSQLRAARIVGAQSRHPAGAVVPPVPDEPVVTAVPSQEAAHHLL